MPRDRRFQSRREVTVRAAKPFEPANFALLAIDDDLTHPDDKSAFVEQRRACTNLASRMLRKKGYGRWGGVNHAADDLVSDLVVRLRRAERNSRRLIASETATSAVLLSHAQRALTGLATCKAEGLEEWPEATSSAACALLDDDKRLPTSVLLVVLRELRFRALNGDPCAPEQQITPWTAAGMVALLEDCKERVGWYVLRALLTQCNDAFRNLGTVQLESIDEPVPGIEDMGLRLVGSPSEIPAEAHWLSFEGRQSGALASSLRGAIIRAVCLRLLEELEALHDDGQVADVTCMCLRSLFSAFVAVLEDPASKPYTHARLHLVQGQGLTDAAAKAGLAAAQRHPLYHRLLTSIRGALWQ